jgi:fumarylacetoacetate (FAA) hydrolase
MLGRQPPRRTHSTHDDMKLATYKDGSRDGQLIVVSRDLSTAHFANGIATRLQQLLDDWNFIAPQLDEIYTGLNHGRLRHAFAFDPKLCMAPLPRAFHHVEATNAYPAHAQRVAAALGLQAADTREPLLAQRGSDELLGAEQRARFASEALGIDFGAGLVALTGDLPQGVAAAQALEGVRLLMLANGWSLRSLQSAEIAAGQGLLHSRPATAFAPVAVTPDELGEALHKGRVQLTVQTMWNGRKVGLLEAGGADLKFHFGELIAQAARLRPLRAGSLVGAGTVANDDASRGYGCVAEKRGLEIADGGEAKTETLKFGDTVRIDIKGRDGQSVFGAIDQEVVSLAEPETTAADAAASA